jgi:hypothetical protein
MKNAGSRLLKNRFSAVALFVFFSAHSIPAQAIISQVSSAKLDFAKGSLTLKYFDDKVEITPHSINTTREVNYGVDLLAPVTGLFKLFSGSKTKKLSPLDFTYVRMFGDPDDFGLFSLQSICDGGHVLMARWYFQKMNINSGAVEMIAMFVSGSATIGAMVENQLPWMNERLPGGPDDLCAVGAVAGENSDTFFSDMRLKSHAPKDPTGIYNYEYDRKTSLKISWDPTKWYDKVENDAVRLSKEIRDLLKRAEEERQKELGGR